MKYLKFVFVLMLSMFLYACNDVVELDDVIDKLIETIPFEVSSDLDISNTFSFEGETYNITYTSNNLDAISNEGKVYRGFKDISTSINLKVSNDDNEIVKEVFINIAKLTQNDIKDLIITATDINPKVTADIILPTTLEYNIYEANLKWISSNPDIITNDGDVSFKTVKQNVTLSLEFKFDDVLYTYSNLYSLEVEAISEEELLEFTANSHSLPENTNEDINLPAKINEVSMIWTSSHPGIISSSGKFSYPNVDTDVQISATFYYKGKTLNKTYIIKALTLSAEEKFNIALNKIDFSSIIYADMELPTSFDYGVTGTWKSNNPDIITNSGLVTLSSTTNQFSITLTLKAGDETMEKDFYLKTGTVINFNTHHYVGYATDFDSENFNSVKLVGDRITLVDGATIGFYESPVFKTKNFSSLVGSWAAITNKTTTAELKVRVRVNGVWSSYLSYGTFGLGLQNKMVNQSGGVARLIEDELMVNNSLTADAFQYQVVLRRDNVSVESAKLSLASITLQIPSYTYNVDILNLPKKVEYDLPNLYQIDVPVIGNLICSVTSSTMLLMYHGHTFTDPLPHRENSPLFREYNTGIYGNWVFNTVGMSAFGENTYVKRIYSIEELFHHLATVGPVALSIKGNTGRYTTNGHLIVVSGYEITDSGRSILVHDPNLPEVEYKYSEAIFNGFTRNVIYVMEKK